MTNRKEILGLPCDTLSFQGVLERIDEFISRRKPRLIITLNAEMSVIAQHDKELFEIISGSDLIVPDGMGIIFALRLLYRLTVDRITGIDLMMKMMELSARKGYKIFLLGAAEDVIQQAKKTLQERFNNLNIVGIQHGYFENDEIVSRQIAMYKPDILFVGIGSPKQEKWIHKHLEKMNVPICMGIGGSFDVIAGKVKRAPFWMQRCGLEWLFRFIHEPWRIKRGAALPVFVFLVLRQWWGNRKKQR